ncbi:RNA recognition motif domain-containing protein [Chitinophagaceae bacterium MMS25-I14]
MKLFVGNLSSHTTEKQLEHLFIEFGEVKSATIITDNYTRRSRGFGFVEMENRESAEKAILKLNNTSLQGQTIVVNEAKEKTSGGGNGGFAAKKGFNRY